MSNLETTIPVELLDALDRLVEVLNDRQIDYALIGGLGVSVRGNLRATRDIDLLLTVPQLQLPPLLESLADEDFQCEINDAIQSWNGRHMLNLTKGSVQVDWIKAMLPVFQKILQRAAWEEIREQRIRVADAEGLLLLKLIPFRPRDQEDIQAILSANRSSLDLDWVRQQWSAIADANDSRTIAFEQFVDEFYAPVE